MISGDYNVGVKEELDKTEVPIELLLLAMVEIGIFQVCYFGQVRVALVNFFLQVRFGGFSFSGQIFQSGI